MHTPEDGATYSTSQQTFSVAGIFVKQRVLGECGCLNTTLCKRCAMLAQRCLHSGGLDTPLIGQRCTMTNERCAIHMSCTTSGGGVHLFPVPHT